MVTIQEILAKRTDPKEAGRDKVAAFLDCLKEFEELAERPHHLREAIKQFERAFPSMHLS
jgi:hypothetical protein